MVRILYVDDEADICEIVSIALSFDPQIHVEVASTGRQALERLRRGGIDLVLLDVMMPEMDGPATLAHLQSDASIPDVPVVFVTARTQRAEIDDYLASGAIGVICKPFDPMTLAEEVKKFALRNAA